MPVFGLSEGVVSAILVLITALSFGPRSLLTPLLALRPGWALLVAASATSLVPFVESAQQLFEYKPRNPNGAAYETDVRWLQSQVTLFRALLIGASLFAFACVQKLSSKYVTALAAEERAQNKLYAMTKQAESVSSHSMKMMEEHSKAKGGESQEAGKLEKLLSETVEWRKRAEAAEKEADVLKSQAKAFNREHDRLLEQIAQLEKQQDSKANERKKDK
mmetsp:Transcript_14353/g.36328  ORF Transcript_14353/g.36328 Transcript_14353/m.36328 type:complete len:219 (+) Transcript_14353:98-754(+)